ncbi:MAG TPA: hypothetical protein PLO16_11725 [Acidocella sp.]|nr:hypothetical protein [Acidocella sp.]
MKLLRDGKPTNPQFLARLLGATPLIANSGSAIIEILINNANP